MLFNTQFWHSEIEHFDSFYFGNGMETNASANLLQMNDDDKILSMRIAKVSIIHYLLSRMRL